MKKNSTIAEEGQATVDRSVLFMDDCCRRQKTFRSNCPWATIVSTANEAIDKLSLQSWDRVYLDHDLNGEVYVDSNRNDCGMEVVRFLESTKISIGMVICHSYNEAARKEMVRRLAAAGYCAEERPFQPDETFCQ